MSAAPQIAVDSWEVAFRRHHRALLREALRYTKDEDLAHEAVAEVWLGCARTKPVIRSNARAYLLKAVRREAIRRVRSAQQDQARRQVTVSGEIPIQGLDPEEEVGALELRRHLRKSLSEIPEPERALFDDWLLGTPLRELEEKHGVPRQSAHRSIQRTKKKIGLRLSRRLGIALLLTLVNALLFLGTVLAAYFQSESLARDARSPSAAALRSDPRTGERDESSAGGQRVRSLPAGIGSSTRKPGESTFEQEELSEAEIQERIRRETELKEESRIQECVRNGDHACVAEALGSRPASSLGETQLAQLINARRHLARRGEASRQGLSLMRLYLERFPFGPQAPGYRRVLAQQERSHLPQPASRGVSLGSGHIIDDHPPASRTRRSGSTEARSSGSGAQGAGSPFGVIY